MSVIHEQFIKLTSRLDEKRLEVMRLRGLMTRVSVCYAGKSWNELD